MIETEKLINIFFANSVEIFFQKRMFYASRSHTLQCESHRNVPIEFWTLIFRTVVFPAAAGDIT